jgi:hypothetical protein
MKAFIRRLHRLEEDSVLPVDLASQRIADLLRERRRRRMEAAGLPFKDLPRALPLPGARRLSVAETLRDIRRTRYRAAVNGANR